MTTNLNAPGPIMALIAGSPLDDTISGSGRDDIIDAGGGADTVNGAAGNDVINGDAGNDYLIGAAGDDTLNGGDDNDVLNGGLGLDTLNGGLGDDTYIWDGVDVINELLNQGVDTIQTAFSANAGFGVENIRMTGTADIEGVGNSLNNVITGNAGDNLLVGLAGSDTLNGGVGQDNLFGGADNDILNGGSDDDRLNGGDGNDVMNGDSGNDFLDGGLGADTMSGGVGHDSYVVDNVGDKVIEAANQGTDTVSTGLHSYRLTANVENLVGTSTDEQLLYGNAARNVITGGVGGDLLSGGGGADTLIGGIGSDRLVGGLGNDTFIITNAEMSRSSLGGVRQTDLIADFDWVAGDRIDLSNIDANVNVGGNQAFTFVSTFSHTAGEARQLYIAASNLTTIHLDVDGDGVSDYQLNLRGGDFRTAPIISAEDPVYMGGWIL